MNLKKRLTITFITLTCLPIFMTVIAFVLLSGMVSFDLTNPVKIGMASLESISTITELTEETYYDLEAQLKIDPDRFSKMDYLESVNQELDEASSFLLVRKGNAVYFTGNEDITADLFLKLPPFDDKKTEAGYYYQRLNLVVKQLDFRFKDGDTGSIFIVTMANQAVSKHLVIRMFMVIVTILIFTSLALTRWINKGVFYPIRQLNHAMSRIADGDFDYVLEKDENNGEIGELYKSYEDMRLKLKESTEEKIQHEKQNRELISNITHDLKTPITSIK